MKPQRPKKTAAVARRQVAEAQLKKQNRFRPPQSEADVRRLQHELEVHQIELEMQNAEMHAAQMEIASVLDRYVELFDFAPIGYFNLAANGTIRLVNLTGAKLLRVERGRLIGRRLGLWVAETDRKKFSEFLARVFKTPKNAICELTLSFEGHPALVVQLDAKREVDGGQCRLVMLEITERCRAESKLRQSEERYQALFNRSLDCVYINDFEGNILDANQAALDLLGYRHEEVSKLNFASLLTEDQLPLAFQVTEEVVKTGRQFKSAEFRLRGKDGRQVYVETYSSLIFRDGQPYAIQGVARDLTARKQAEAALMASEKKFRQLFDTITDPFVSVNMAGQIQEFNAAFRKLLGYSDKELKRLTYQDLTPAKLHAFEAGIIKRQVLSRGHSEIYEKEYRRKDGVIIPVELRTLLIRDDQGKPLMMWAIVRDITERKRAEERLAAVDRALKTTSACNRALVRAENESELLQEICRAIIEQGGYRMVWIGFPEADEKKSVRVAASAGYEKGYLQLAKITWLDDDDRGRGPSGVAFRNGKIVVCNDFQNDPITGPWRKEAAERGYASSISLPLKHAGESFGLMMIYAAQTNAFLGDEKNLLAELADDLSFGMKAMRDRQKRELTEAALRSSEDRFRKLFTEHAAAKLVTDANTGQIVDANEAAARFYGWSVAQLKQMQISQINTLDGAALKRVIRKVKTAVQSRFEFQHRLADGSLRDVEVYSNRIVIAGQTLLHSIIQDITQRKQAEERNHRLANELKLILETVPTGIAYLKGRRVVSANLTFDRIFGYAPGGTVDLTTVAFYASPRDFERVGRDGHTALARGETFRIELPMRRQDGSVFPCCLTGRAINPQNAADGSIWQLEDITERKQAEESLLRRQQILQAVGLAAEQLLRSTDWRDSILKVLAGLGEATSVSRVVVWQTHDGKRGARLISQLYEWFSGGLASRVDDPTVKNLPLVDSGFGRWGKVLGSGMAIQGLVRDLPASEQPALKHHKILAIAVVPVMVDNQWWGFIAFDECRQERAWGADEIEALQAAARILGEAIQREQVEKSLYESEWRFREMVQNIPAVAVQSYGYDGITHYWNSASEKLYGYTAAEAVGKNLLDLIIPPEMRPGVRQAIQHMAQTGLAIPASELTLMRKDGSRVTVFSSHAIVQVPGRSPELFCIDVDLTERKQVELALRASEENYRKLFAQMLDGFAVHEIICDDTGKPVDYRFLSVNPSFERLTGLRAADVLGRTVREVIPDTEQSWIERYGQVALTGVPQVFEEYSVPLKKYFEVSVFQSHPGGFATVFLDITDRKRAEQEIARQASFARLNPNPVLELSAAGDLLYCNRATLELAESLGLESPSRILPPNTADIVRDCLAANRSNLRLETVEQGRTISWSFFPVTQDNVVHCYAGDITARKQAEEMLRARERDFRTLAESVPQIVWVTRPDGWNIYFNPQWVNYTGLTLDESYGHGWSKPFHPDDQPRAWDAWQNAVQNNSTYSVECRLRRADGVYRWWLIRGEPLRDEDGKILKWFGTCTDIEDIKLASARLEETAIRLKESHRIASLGSYALDVVSGIWTSSEMLDTIFGIGPDHDHSLAGWANLIHPDDRAMMLDYLQNEVLGHNKLFNKEYRILRPHSQVERWVHGLGKVECDAQGQPVKMIGTIQDITKSKRAMELMVASEIRYRRLFESAKDGILILDAMTGAVVDVNPFLIALLGYARGEFLGKKIWEMGFFKDVIASEADFAELQAREYIRYENLAVKASDGRRIEVEFISNLYQVNSHKVIQCNIRDITARKRAEEIQLRLATAVEQAAETIVITDTEGEILYANPAFEKSSGYTRAEAIGQNPRLLKSGKQDGAFYRRMWEVLKRGDVWTGHFINQRKDGTLYEEEATISPIRDAAGKITNYVAVKRDVTHEMELEGQLRQSQKMEAIGTLAGGIAHDFNNILNVIFGYSNLLQLDLAGKQDELEKLGEILKAGERAKDLVQQILMFSRQREQERRVIQLNSIIKETAKLLRASLPANLEIETEVAADAPLVLADATQIYQVIMNLGTNALHAMENKASGRLKIALDAFQPDAAILQAHPELRAIKYARITVSDTGCGMDEKTLARIYDPFFTTKPVGKGTGLGLAVVHGIVESHDGVITVESEPGQGTAFRIFLPEQIQDLFQDGIPENLIPCGQGQKILMVDDEAVLKGMYQKLLKALKYEGTIVTNAKAAVGMVRENPGQFDLVITDLTMPEMNGLEVAQAIRAIRADLPVILATGFHGTVSDRQLTDAGICEVVEKPISMARLAMVLRGVLGKV